MASNTTSNRLIDWASNQRDPMQQDQLETTLDETARKDSKAKFREMFGQLLFHLLQQRGYNGTPEAIAQQLAADIPKWQTPPRPIPYDALLVQSWLGGKPTRKMPNYLPEEAAWEALSSYLTD